MKKMFFMTAILVVFLFVPKIVFGNVIINEVFYDPSGVDTGKEYIRLYNNGDSSVDLTNWSIDPSSANYFIIPSFTLDTKSFVNIHIGTSGTNTATDLYDNGLNNMSNTSGPVALFNHPTTHKAETFVDYIEYGVGGQTNESEAVKAGIWTINAFIPDITEGKTIKLKTDGVDNNLPSDWTETTPSIIQQEEPPSGLGEESPSAPSDEASTSQDNNNILIADAGDNIIAFTGQEIKFDGSKSSDPNGDELAYSWNMGDGKLIEQVSFTYKYNYPGTYLVTLMVYNGRTYASETITIKIQPQQITINEFLPNPSGKDEEDGWIEIYNGSDSIVDISNWQLDNAASESTAFVFPQNTLIAPKSYLVFSRQITNIALNNDKDSIRLLFPEGIVFQEINYEKPPQGKSSARTDEGFVWNLPTPGAPNISGIIISENKNVSYQNPVDTQTTKEPSQDYAVLFQNQTENKINGGYTALTKPQNNIQNPENSQLAVIAPNSSKQNQNNLFLIITIIVLSGILIGILLIKFLKKYP